MRRRLETFSACALLILSSSVSQAANPTILVSTSPPVSAQTTWKLSATGYLWASGIKGTLATIPPLPAVAVDASFGDLVKNLGGAFMGAFEARYGRFLVLNDVMATQLKPEGARARGPLAVNVNIDSTSFIGLAALGYRVVDGTHFTFDVLVGVRGFYMGNELRVSVAAGPVALGQTFSETKTWVDAVGGVRMRYQFDDHWTATLAAFAGGGASKYQWDIYSGVGYSFNRSWAALAGYRVFKVDYSDGGFIYDVLQHGPLVGLQYRW
jgi:hypothetical protein